MQTKKIIKKTLLILVSIIVLFFAILLYHIITIKPEVTENQNLQVSRIDFKTPLDSLQAKQVCKDLRTIKGLTSDSIIVKNNVVVYFHNNSITNSSKVFNQLMAKRNYDAVRFLVTDSLANKKVCPVDHDSFSYKLSKSINHFFN